MEAAHATRLPAELVKGIKILSNDAKIRLDGAFEAQGDLYLPVLPAKITPVKEAEILETHPAKTTKPDVMLFSDGIVYLRVIEKGGKRSLTSPAFLDDKIRKHVLAGHLPSDLIVPDAFLVAPEYKPILGDLAITVSKEKSPIIYDHGKTTGDSGKPAHKIVGGIFLTSPSSGAISLIDEQTLKKTVDFPTEGTPTGMALVGSRIYIADQSKNRVLMLDPTARQFLGQIDLPPKSAPKDVVALPNGKLIYVSESAAGSVDCIEIETGKILIKTKVPPGPSRMAITPNGNSVIVLNVPTGQVSVISTMNQKVLGSISVGGSPTAVVISPNGQLAYISCKTSNHIAVLDITKRAIVSYIKTGNGPTGMVLLDGGKRLLVALAKDNVIAEMDPATRAVIKEYKLPMDVDFPGGLALFAGGKKVVVTSAATDTVGILDLEKGAFSQSVIGHNSDGVLFVETH